MKKLLLLLLACMVVNSLAAEDNHIESKEFIENFYNLEEYETIVRQNNAIYNNYINQKNLIDSLTITEIKQSTDFGAADKKNILLFVNMDLYTSSIDSVIDIYINDIEQENYAAKLLTANNSRDVSGFRDYLANQWKTNSIEGVFLIGDLPVAHYEMSADFGESDNYAKFPTDIYFMDLDGEWGDNLESGAKGVFDSHSGFRTKKIDIWVGRLYPSVLTCHGDTEEELVLTYFDKVHQYRTGKLRLKDQAINYIDKDWTGYDVESEQRYAYNRMTTYKHDINTECSRSDFRSKVQQYTNNKFEWGYFALHSWHKGHQFTNGPEFPSSWIDQINVQVMFYLNFNCSGALFTGEDCLCSWYTMQKPYGLISVGSTKTGSMLYQRKYYEAIGQGMSIGESFLDWGRTYIERDPSWHYGMVILGDPTLRISRFMDTPNPDFCYSVTPENKDLFEQQLPEFRWTKTDSAAYYKVNVYNSSERLIFSSEQLTDTLLTFDISQYPSTKATYYWNVEAFDDKDNQYDFTQKRQFSLFYKTSDDLYLSEINPVYYSQDWGDLQFDETINGNTMSIAGEKYYKGLGTHANSEIVYAIDSLSQIYQFFTAIIGHDDESDGENADGVKFIVVVDGDTLFGPSNTFHNGDPGEKIEVNIADADTLRLLIDKIENDYNDHANWAEAKLIKASNAIVKNQTPVINENFVLSNNYPNPFNPVTTLQYKIYKPGNYTLAIYDITGRKIKTLADRYQTNGTYKIQWNATNAYNKPVPSGMYICKLNSAGKSQQIKLLLVR